MGLGDPRARHATRSSCGWCLDHGLRIVQQSTLMTIGLYNEPAGRMAAVDRLLEENVECYGDFDAAVPVSRTRASFSWRASPRSETSSPGR